MTTTDLAGLHPDEWVPNVGGGLDGPAHGATRTPPVITQMTASLPVTRQPDGSLQSAGIGVNTMADAVPAMGGADLNPPRDQRWRPLRDRLDPLPGREQHRPRRRHRSPHRPAHGLRLYLPHRTASISCRRLRKPTVAKRFPGRWPPSVRARGPMAASPSPLSSAPTATPTRPHSSRRSAGLQSVSLRTGAVGFGPSEGSRSSRTGAAPSAITTAIPAAAHHTFHAGPAATRTCCLS